MGREDRLLRYFSAYSCGLPGLGLLLLRAAAGLTAIIQGWFYLADGANQSVGLWAVGLLALASGISLLIGLLTPLAGGLTAIGAIGIGAAWLPRPTTNLLATLLPAIFMSTTSLALVLLGPGPYSLDARLFGRREIIIPPPSNSAES